jgi:hypothetical protein
MSCKPPTAWGSRRSGPPRWIMSPSRCRKVRWRLPDLLTKKFEATSLFWLLVGALVGTIVKLVFDHYLAPKVSRRTVAIGAISRYSNPLLQATERLSARLRDYFAWGRSAGGGKAGQSR